jgi:hypothetical protein
MLKYAFLNVILKESKKSLQFNGEGEHLSGIHMGFQNR